MHVSESPPRLSTEVHRFLCSGAKNWARDIEIAVEMDSWPEEEDTAGNIPETGEKKVLGIELHGIASTFQMVSSVPSKELLSSLGYKLTEPSELHCCATVVGRVIPQPHSVALISGSFSTYPLESFACI